MKIAINGMFWDRPTTGSGQYVRALVAALKARAPHNTYVVIAPPAVGGRSSSAKRVRDNLGKVWFEQIAFRNACRRERVTFAHVPYFGSPFFLPTRTVVTIHDLIPLILPAYRGAPLVRAYTRLAAASARRATAIIADSECSRRDIIARLHIAPARVHVVYLAAGADYAPAPNRARIDAVRRQYALPEKYLLYLGGYDQRKNVRVLIEALAQMPMAYAAGYRLALAGALPAADSAFFPDPRRLARQAGLPADAICYAGQVAEADKPALYAGARVFLFPSRYEGFGLPPLEAMACGVPVVCADASSLPEVVGAAARRVAPDDVRAWADAIGAVMDDDALYSQMRADGIAQAQKFSWARTAEETLAVYAQVA